MLTITDPIDLDIHLVAFRLIYRTDGSLQSATVVRSSVRKRHPPRAYLRHNRNDAQRHHHE